MFEISELTLTLLVSFIYAHEVEWVDKPCQLWDNTLDRLSLATPDPYGGLFRRPNMPDQIQTWQEQVAITFTFDLTSFIGPRQEKDMQQLKDAIEQFVRETKENPHINADIAALITREIRSGITDDQNIGSIKTTLALMQEPVFSLLASPSGQFTPASPSRLREETPAENVG